MGSVQCGFGLSLNNLYWSMYGGVSRLLYLLGVVGGGEN